MTLLEKIVDLVENHKPSNPQDIILHNYLDDLTQIIPSIGVEPLDRWKKFPSDPVKPDEMEDVLVYLGDGLVEVARYYDGQFDSLAEVDVTDMVTHWRTLPVAPLDIEL